MPKSILVNFFTTIPLLLFLSVFLFTHTSFGNPTNGNDGTTAAAVAAPDAAINPIDGIKRAEAKLAKKIAASQQDINNNHITEFANQRLAQVEGLTEKVDTERERALREKEAHINVDVAKLFPIKERGQAVHQVDARRAAEIRAKEEEEKKQQGAFWRVLKKTPVGENEKEEEENGNGNVDGKEPINNDKLEASNLPSLNNGDEGQKEEKHQFATESNTDDDDEQKKGEKGGEGQQHQRDTAAGAQTKHGIPTFNGQPKPPGASATWSEWLSYCYWLNKLYENGRHYLGYNNKNANDANANNDVPHASKEKDEHQEAVKKH